MEIEEDVEKKGGKGLKVEKRERKKQNDILKGKADKFCDT